MNQPEELDDLQKKDGTGQAVDICTSEEAGEINTPDLADKQQHIYSNDMSDNTVINGDYYNNNSYNNSDYNNDNYNSSNYNNDNYNNGNYPNNDYHNKSSAGAEHHNNYYDNNYYDNRQPQNGNLYQSSPYGNQQSQYESPYQNSPYGNRQPQNGTPYQNGPYGYQQSQNGNPYQGNPYQNNPYGYQQHQSGDPYNNSYNNNPYNNNPYSPYAAPAKKSNVPLIIGIVAGIIVLFLIAVAALTYRVISLYSEEREKSRRSDKANEYDQGPFDQDGYDSYDDFDYDYFYDYGDDYFDEYDYDYFYDYGDDYFNDYDSDQYYNLHDDIRSDLSYSVDFDEYEYTDDEKVVIRVSYPVIEGKDVPNLSHLNEVIQDEVELFEEYLEEYKGYLDNEDSFFSAVSMGYVTYMDEEKLSIVFSENIYADLYSYAYLYCINIDMENGVILENENMLSIDDDFSVEFRTKSDIQNGEISYLTGMTDQEITNYFNSSDVIVFYTPKGMEIGFNYEAGWVTVTYEEYEEYLKVF